MKTARLFIIAAIALSGLLAALPQKSFAQNLLTNPDFETGDTSGWTKSGTHMSGATTSNVYSGTYSLYIATAASTGMKPYFQNFNVYTGKRYVFNGYVYLDGATNYGCGIGVRSGGGALSALGGAGNAVSSITATGVWTYVAGSSIVPVGVTIYGFNAYLRTNGTLTPWSTGYFDNLYFAPAPAPPAITGFAAEPGVAGGQVALSWTSPAGSAGYGDALAAGSTFYIQYASWTGVAFSTATQPPVGGYDLSIPTGSVTAGTSVYYTVGGLTDGVTYYFRIWTKDAAGQWSDISAIEATSYAKITTDFLPPDAISDLETLAITQDNKITLKWTSPGNDGATGNLSGAYLIQYASETTIGSVAWAYSSAQINISTSGVAPGSTNQYTATLAGGTTYYFRIWSRDLANNYSTISNGATIQLPLMPPAAITDLTATLVSAVVGSVRLTWTSPADSPSGAAVNGYTVRYATFNAAGAGGASSWWNLATDARNEPSPTAPGTTQIMTISGLPGGQNITLHIRSTDSVNNLSAIDSGTEHTIAVPAHLLISEVQFQSGTNDYIELYNPTDAPINLQTLPLNVHQRTASGATDNLLSLSFSNATIPSKGYFLITCTATYSPGGKTADATISPGQTGNISSDNSVYISLSATALVDIIDVAAFGNGTDTAFVDFGDPNAPARHSYAGSATQSVERKPGGGAGSTLGNAFDSNKFNYDFDVINLDPQNTSDAAEPPPTVPNAPSWVAGEIVVGTDTIKWVLKNEHSAAAEIFVSTYPNTDSRIAGAELGSIASAGTTSWISVNLTSNTVYTRYGEAYLASGSSWSAPSAVCTLAYPPTTLAAGATVAGVVNLTWNFSGASKYLVARSLDNFATPWSTSAVVLSPGTTHQDLGLAGHTTYYYRIYPLNQSDAATLAFPSVTVSTCTPPAAPTAFTRQSAAPTQIVWQWSASAGGADGYRVYQASSPATLVADVGSLTTYTEQNLSTNTAYGRFVRAYNLAGASGASNQATFYTLAAAPSALDVAAVYQSSVSLVWTANGNPANTRFGLARAENSGFTVNHTTFAALASALVEPATVAAGLGGNTSYYFRAWAYNEEGAASAYSNVASTLTPAAPPAQPIGLAGVAVSTTIVKWEWNITANATFYRIYTSPGDTLLANLDGNGTTTWFDNALSSNTQYTRYVKAGNDQGLSPASSNASRYTHAYPPGSMTAAAVSSSTINLSWPDSGASKYQVWVSTVAPGAAPLANPTTAAAVAYAHAALVAGVTHYYRLIPVNGNDIAYDAFNFPTTSTRTWPAPVVSLSSSAATTTTITWSWPAAVGADGYFVLMATSPSTVVGQTAAGITSFVSQNLSTNTAYGRVVRAYNTSGAGAVSPSATFYTLAATPGTPVVDGVTTNSVSLSWSANTNPSGTRYGVIRSQNNFASTNTLVGYADALTLASYTDNSVSGGTGYQYKVTAFNGDAVAAEYTSAVSTATNSLPNLLTNGGFETGDTSGWLTGGTAVFGVETSTVYAGAYSGRIGMTTTTGKKVFYQSVAVTAGSTYNLSGYVFKNDAAITYIGLLMNPNGGSAASSPAPSVSNSTTTAASMSTWQYLSMSTVVPTGVTTMGINLILNYAAGATTGYFDNITFTEVPDTKPPNAISNLTALPGATDGEINLAWSAPSDDGLGVKPLTGGYIIKYSSVQMINSADFAAPAFVHGSVVFSTSGVTPGGAVGRQFSLNPGTTYWFAIKSTDTAGNLSVWNSSADNGAVNTLAFCPAQDFPPPTPTTLVATPNDTMIALTWSAGGAITDLDRYELYCDSTSAYDFGDQFLATATINTSFTHSNLENGVTYYYRVRAVDTPPNVLSSNYSNVISTFPRPSAPFAPSLTYDLAQTTTFQIRWLMTDNAGNETGLHISSDTNTGARLWSSASLASTGGTTSWVEAGFGANEAVVRYGEASNAVGSNWTGAVTRYTRAIAPAALAADAVYFSSVSVSWSDNGNPAGTRYEVSVSSDIFNLYYSTPVTLGDGYIFASADLTGLNPGATYWLRVRAYNDADVATAFCSTMSVVTERVPTAYLKIANAGFELANFSGWTKDSSSGSDPSQSTTQKRSGSYSVNFLDPVGTYFPSSTRRRMVSSTSTVVAGNNYSVGLWGYVVNEGAGAAGDTKFRIGIMWLDAAGAGIYTSTSAPLNVTAFATWEKLAYSAVAPASAAKAVMVIDVWEDVNNNNDAYIDDVDNAPDTIAPGAITDLAAAKGANPGEVNITWTAPGDDGYAENNGASAVYTLRYATYPMVAASSWTWRNNAIVYYQQWPVAAVGTTESRTLSLVPGVTYYFLIRTQDAAGNVSYFDVKSIDTPQATACAKEGVKRGVVINEVAPDQTSGQGYDFIELYNPGPDTPDIKGWEIFEYYTQDAYLEKVEGNWTFPANTYLVIRFSQVTRQMTSPVQINPTYFELYTNKSGLSQTDNVIMVSTGGAGATVVDVVCFADMSGSLTNSTRLRAAYNAAISTGQWFGPLSDGTNDAVVETYMASTLYNASSNWAIARNNLSTDSSNPSRSEWAMNYTTSRGAVNTAFDSVAPSAVNTLVAVSGENRGTMRLTWTAVGDDSATGTAAGYILRSRTDIMDADNFDASANYSFASKEGQSDTDRWAPKASGQSESYLIGGFTAGATYYLGIKVQDERPNTSAISNVVSTIAANVVGSNVRINEIAPLTASADWIEFYCARGPVNVNGWKVLGIITGGTSETTLKTLPNITLQTGDYLVYNCVAGTDETDASGKGANGYWDVYGANDLRGFEGVVTLKDNFNNIVDFLAYSQGVAPSWNTIWGSASTWKQWSPTAASVGAAADWSGGDAAKSLGRDGFSTDTDDTLSQARVDWKVFAVPSKGGQNDDIAPGAITNLSALADAAVEGKITLTWTAPGDDVYAGNNSGGYYIVKYATFPVSVGVSSWTWWNSISTGVASDINKGWAVKTPSAVSATETYIYNNLYPAATYYFAVRTVDDMLNWSELDAQIGVNSAASQSQAVVTNLPPPAPASLAAVSSNTAVLLSWSASSALDLKEYRVSSNTVNNFGDAATSLVAVVPAGSTSINAGGLINGVTYYFWVQATDNFGLTGSTSSVAFTMPVIRPPSGLSLNHDGTAIRLAWTASPDSGAANFAGYAVYRSTVSASSGFTVAAVLSGGTTHQDASGIESTKTYYYFLRSSDTAGPLSYATSVSTAVPDSEPPVITLRAPSSDPLVVEIKGAQIVFEADAADSQATAYIAGVATQTVKVNFVVSGVTTTLALDEISNVAYVTATTRVLSARFKKSIDAQSATISDALKSILAAGGTFYYYVSAEDGVGNAASAMTPRKIIVKTEPKTSAAILASAGGTISLSDGNPDDGATSVTIPPGALKSDATITIKQDDPSSAAVPPATTENSITTAVNDGKPVAVYDFGPSGTVFASPVTITLLYFESGGAVKNIAGATVSGATEDNLKIYWYDGVEWRYVGGVVDKTKNTVTAKVGHFSLYALFVSKGAPEKPAAAEKFVTPNGDGINDVLDFDGSASDFEKITIYDINGRVVRSLDGTDIWDGRDDSGKVVEIGAYIWKAVYTDGKSNYGTVVIAK